MPQKKIQKPTKCYHCGREIRDSRDLVEKKIPLHTRSGIRMYRRKFHINCIPKYFENLDTESETMQEQSDWIKCYELFRKLLGIKEDIKKKFFESFNFLKAIFSKCTTLTNPIAAY